MEFALRKDETFAEGWRRLMRDRSIQAVASLSDEAVLHEDGIHQARKRLKEMRSLIRLIEPSLSPELKKINRGLSDIGRSLSDARDAEVLYLTFRRVRNSSGKLKKEPTSKTFQKQLKARVKGEIGSELGAPSVAATARVRLSSVIEQLAHSSPLSRASAADIDLGLQKLYRRARKDFSKLKLESSPDEFHEWRKWVKHLAMAMHVLQDSHPASTKKFRSKIENLASTLGVYHDHDVLESWIRTEPDSLSDRARELTLAEIARQSQKLKSNALDIASKLFKKKPNEFAPTGTDSKSTTSRRRMKSHSENQWQTSTEMHVE